MRLPSRFLLLFLLAMVAVQAHGQSSRKVKAVFTWDIGNTASTDELNIRAQIPATIERVQKVNSVKYSIEPQEVHVSDGESYAVFIFPKDNIPSKIVIEADMVLYKHGLSNQKLKSSSESVPDLSKYMKDEHGIEVSDPAIKQLADSLKGKNPEATIRKICYYLADNITYKSREAGSSVETLKSREGNCVGKSNLMAALCRANSIPARIVSGFLLNQSFLPGWDGETGHVWVEAWIPQLGWVAFEPVRTQPKTLPLPWQTMPTDYVYLSNDQRNSEVRWRFDYRWRGGRPRVDGVFRVE